MQPILPVHTGRKANFQLIFSSFKKIKNFLSKHYTNSSLVVIRQQIAIFPPEGREVSDNEIVKVASYLYEEGFIKSEEIDVRVVYKGRDWEQKWENIKK